MSPHAGKESEMTLKRIEWSDLSYAAQTESGDKAIAIRGHVSIVCGVPQGHGNDMFPWGKSEARMCRVWAGMKGRKRGGEFQADHVE
jgi:hypothetical protein